MYNRRPISKKKQVQFMIALTILAWATQTLHRQWGFGAEVHPEANTAARIDAAPTANVANGGDADDAVAGGEKFVPGSARFALGAVLEMRSEATVVGGEIKLKQVCRWSDADKAVFAPVADFVLARLSPGVPFKSVTVADIKSTLRDAGVNLAAIDFVGTTACTVSRSDVHYDERTALDQWITARQGADAAPSTMPTTRPADNWADAATSGVKVTAAASATAPAVHEAKQFHTLREVINADLASRTGLPVESLQMTFSQQDEQVLNLSEPLFHFQLDPLRARNLGNVSWNVQVLADGGTQRVRINAEARAWQKELVLAHPLAARQVVQDDDCIERRTLVDSLPNEPLLTREQLIGQQASRELKPGTVMTNRMVDAVALVRAGQFVTITVTQGTIQIRTVARAMENGTYGQSIRVKNETTRDIFEVSVTGPQTATMDSMAAAPRVASANEP